MIRAFCQELGIPGHTETVMNGYNDGSVNIVTIERAGAIAGLAGYIIKGNEAHAEILYVVPQHRRSRVAYDLYEKTHLSAKEKGCIRAVLFTKKERAKMYSRHGYQEDYVLMSREL